MITFFNFLIYMSALTIQSIKTPMKSISLMIATGSVVFAVTWYISASSWLPLIYFLMFMGGIMVMFMLVSSVVPNEKPNKMVLNLAASLFLLSIPLVKSTSSLNFLDLKWNFQSYFNMLFLCVLLISYFFMFMYALGAKSTTLNSKLCFLSEFCKFNIKSS